MNRIMTHIVGGYPSFEINEKVALAMIRTGVEFIEIQIPFSDPVADGPTIAMANKVSLEKGTKPKDCLQFMKKLKAKVGAAGPKLLFMTYYNIIFNYGLEKFCKAAKEAGAYGLIVPDIPPDEEPYEGYLKNCKKYGLHAIQIISPLTKVSHIKSIASLASGFIYCVSTTGKTGVRGQLDGKAIEYLRHLREYTKLPLALGFGIANQEQVHQALQKADIAVIGSKLIQIVDAAPPGEADREVETFLNQLS